MLVCLPYQRHKVMKTFLSLFILIISLHIQAQTPGVKLGVQFTQDNISGNGFVAAEPSYFANRIDRDKFNFSMGFTAQFLTNSSFSFESGLLYSQKDFSSTYSCPNCLYMYLSSYIIAPQPVDIKNRFISIPFLVRYDLYGKKLSPIFEAGINNNFLVNDGDFERTKSAYMEGVLGLGLAYKFNKILSAELKYNYRKALTSVYDDTDMTYFIDEDPNKQRTQSLQFTISYSLKR